jgi:hypothetical protein
VPEFEDRFDAASLRWLCKPRQPCSLPLLAMRRGTVERGVGTMLVEDSADAPFFRQTKWATSQDWFERKTSSAKQLFEHNHRPAAVGL